ncbi:MAG: PhnD/SsuA/transferrin family substrate-binding protein [Alphaproteobacteria bacterium]|nr:PhnD/SsuA/transferrin family substrate-binding protein [Alphaproteobacteria bacterium]
MIANARMYSVTPSVAALWRSLLGAILSQTGETIDIVDHAPPAPISELWRRPDKAAVFMCGLPFGLAIPRPVPVAAPVPSPAAYGGRACYWSDIVVHVDSPFQTIEQTFGHRLALTTPESQSGYAALLHALMPHAARTPLYGEIIEPRFTPMGVLTAVIERKAEVAPLDSYAFALLSKHAPEVTAQVRTIMRTEPTAAPLLVASGPVAAAVTAAFLTVHENGPAAALMDHLLLDRFVQPEGEAYDDLKERFLVMQAFWRRHPLAKTAHPLFAAELEGNRPLHPTA